MSSIKRQIRRKQRQKGRRLKIKAYAQDGNVCVVMRRDTSEYSTVLRDTGLPDCKLPWLAEKIQDRIELTGLAWWEDNLSIADKVIEEEKARLLALAEKQTPGVAAQS